jgi:hypothetical protein
LARLERTLTPQDVFNIKAASGERTLHDLANAIPDAIDPDRGQPQGLPL